VIRPQKRRLTWAIYGEVCQRLAAGESVTAIAPAVGMSETTLHIKLRALGLAPAAVARPAMRGKGKPRPGHQFDLLQQAWREAA
jgi:hypothetical protein